MHFAANALSSRCHRTKHEDHSRAASKFTLAGVVRMFNRYLRIVCTYMTYMQRDIVGDCLVNQCRNRTVVNVGRRAGWIDFPQFPGGFAVNRNLRMNRLRMKRDFRSSFFDGRASRPRRAKFQTPETELSNAFLAPGFVRLLVFARTAETIGGNLG